MDIILILRVLITLTFLILAVGGPVAIVQLKRFTTLYARKHAELLVRVEALERRVTRLEAGGHDGKP